MTVESCHGQPTCRNDREMAALRQLYDDAFALVQCASVACPRSASPEKVERAILKLLARVGVEDSSVATRTRSVDLSGSIDYIATLAGVWQKMKAHGVGMVEIEQELIAVGIDWRAQDLAREVMLSRFRVGWAQVRFQEMLLGCGIGDAFGAGVEFWDGEWIHSHVDGKSFICRRGDPVLNFYYSGKDFVPDGDGTGQNFLPGMYTDDCEMTLGLIHALMASDLNGMPTDDVMLRHWKQEYFKGQSHYLLTRLWSLAGIGRNGHGAIAFVYSGAQSIESMRARIAGMKYPGNAPPMRALPLAFVPEDDTLVRLARMNADSTHPHVKARASSLGIAVAARCFVIHRIAPCSIIPVVCAELIRLDALGAENIGTMLDEETLEYLRQVDLLPPPGPINSNFYSDFISDAVLSCLCGPQPVWRGPTDPNPDDLPRRVRGLAADAQRTLGCVVYLLKHHQEGHSMQTLLRSLYIGGDVDSLAALCLAMVGGREGLQIGTELGVPLYMLQMLESAEYIAETADAFEQWVRSQHAKRRLIDD